MSFDFSSLSVNTTKNEENTLSVTQIQQNVKNIAVERVFEYLPTQNMVHTDTHKYAMPIDYNGEIHWVEISFVAKKKDFDPQKAEIDYETKYLNNIKREAERKMKSKNEKKKEN